MNHVEFQHVLLENGPEYLNLIKYDRITTSVRIFPKLACFVSN